MIKGFNETGFIKWVYSNHTIGDELSTRNLTLTVEKIIEYTAKHNHISKNQFANSIAELLPFLQLEEVLAFCEDSILSNDYIELKNNFIYKIQHDFVGFGTCHRCGEEADLLDFYTNTSTLSYCQECYDFECGFVY